MGSGTAVTRFTLILALCQIGLQAGVITQNGVFATQNQGLFAAGAASNFHFDFQTGCPTCFSYTSASWSAPNPQSISGPSILPNAAGSWAITGSLNSGYVGLNPVLDETGGSVAVNYPVQLTYNVPQGPVPIGAPVTIGTSYATNGQPLLQTTGESLSASLNLVASISGDIADTYYPFEGPLGFLINSFDCYQTSCVLFDEPFNISLNQPLISLGTGSTSASFSPPGFGSGLSLNAPNQLNLSTNTLNGSGQLTVGGSANPPIVSGDLELLDGLTFLGVPPGVLNGSFPAFGSSYSLLSAKFSGGLSLYDSFTFGVNNLPITLTSNDGQVQTGFVGQNFTFTAGANPLVINAQVGINNSFNAIEGMGLGASFSWSVLKASAAGFQLGPLAGDSYTLASVSCATLGTCWTNSNFALGGFNTLDNQFVIETVPEPGTLLLLLAGVAASLVYRSRRPAAGGGA